MNYPLKVNKYNWRLLVPQTNTCYTEGRISELYDLYLTTEYTKDNINNIRKYYRLHAKHPHSIEMALAYDIKCPVCNGHILKQVGRCLNYHTLGLYECPICDRKK